MAAFLPLFVDRGAAGLTVAEMYLKHIFPSYTRTNTERALQGSGIAFPPVSGQLLDSNIDRLMRTGYLPQGTVQYPTLGALAAREKADPTADLPPRSAMI